MNGHWIDKVCLGLAWLGVVGIQGVHAEDNYESELSPKEFCEVLQGDWFEDENGNTACCHDDIFPRFHG